MIKTKKAGPESLVMAVALTAIASCSSSYLGAPDGAVPIPDIGKVAAPVEIPATDIVVDPQRILDGHNSIRQRLGVPKLRWSTSLESYAAGWANYLTTELDCEPRRRGSIGLPRHKNGIGENLQVINSVRFDDGRIEVASVDENKVVLGWARQGIDFNYTDNKCGVGKVCDNYTQVVWRDSQVVGCAAASCADKSQIWVCNYDPPGNFVGQKPY